MATMASTLNTIYLIKNIFEIRELYLLKNFLIMQISRIKYNYFFNFYCELFFTGRKY